MDQLIEMAKEMGEAIQMDERFIRTQMAQAAADEDEALQGMIGIAHALVHHQTSFGVDVLVGFRHLIRMMGRSRKHRRDERFTELTHGQCHIL